MSTVVEVRLVPAPPTTTSADATAISSGRRVLPPGGADRDAPATDGPAPTGPTRPRRTAVPLPARRRPPRRPAPVADDAPARQPVVERLGAGSVAAYSHAVPDRVPTEPVPVPALPPGPAGGPAATLDPRQACCMVALAAVEVLSGTRPLAQLARWVTPEVYDTLARRAALTAPRSRVLDPVAAPGDLAGRTESPVRRPSVRRVRAVAVGQDALEASVVVAHAGRVRAVAVRLIRVAGRWRAAALVVG
ncbi:Rv3235 family protein [Cellulomonas sp. C5510]|uniref:Rv3235 family protein n=1 Tax=Cellulomonas sp. C5510 TaxID=2871170 RepID=UPI001C93D2F7|nr:Rv3235 family protein [Cellulomonas sp. C5510]QZN84722.1 energy transducer TonB [Cellulomonas sp. C5510]